MAPLPQNQNMIKVVSFDLDGTLVTQKFGDMVWNYGIPLEFSRKYGIPFDEARRMILSEYVSIGDENPLWYDIYYWVRKFGLDVSVEELLKRYEEFIELREGVIETLKDLRQRFSLILSSNASRVFVEKELSYTGLKEFFDFSFSATSDFGMVKKDVRFFRKILEILNLREEEMIHIGDNRIFDFYVPRSIGIRSILVEEGKSLKEVISDCEEMFQM